MSEIWRLGRKAEHGPASGTGHRVGNTSNADRGAYSQAHTSELTAAFPIRPPLTGYDQPPKRTWSEG